MFKENWQRYQVSKSDAIIYAIYSNFKALVASKNILDYEFNITNIWVFMSLYDQPKLY